MMDLKFQLERLNKNLNILREREAKYGGNAPLDLLNLIDDYMHAVTLIEATLDGQFTPEQLVAEMAPLNVTISLPFSGITETSIEHLQSQLAAFQIAQQYASEPRRFQAKIDELGAMIDDWKDRIEQQKKRIANGLVEMHHTVAQSGQVQANLSVVGQRPLGVVDYFKDRVQEQETIGQLLAKPTTRLVSVIGHGGMGKTALACKVLQDLERYHWPQTDERIPLDGIVYLSTRTSGISLERLFLDCAKLLGGEQEEQLNAIWVNPSFSVEEKVLQLLDLLKEGRYVILLDNLEDLIDDEGKLVDKDIQLFFNKNLARIDGAQLLVTSRQALTFRREVMRFDKQVKLLEGLPVEDGVTLLRELDPNGDYGIRDASKALLARAVSMVHGLPRALEVVTGILAHDPFASLDEILESFYEKEDVVQDLIEENYKRIDTHSRRVIEALAVLRRPVSPLAVDYLLEPFVPGLNTPRVIERLICTNIVSVDRFAKTVTLHPIDQDFAYCQLPEHSMDDKVYTRQALERRAADYYAQLRISHEDWKTLTDLEPQLAEFEHRVKAGDYDDAANLLDEIDLDYLLIWGHNHRVQRMRKKLENKIESKTLQLNQANSLGRSYLNMGHYTKAATLFQQALKMALEIGNQNKEISVLYNLSQANWGLGHFEKQVDLCQQALKIARKIKDRNGESKILSSLMESLFSLGRMDETVDYGQQALKIARKSGDRLNEALALSGLGQIHRYLGHYSEALDYRQQALMIQREMGNRQGEMRQLNMLGLIYISMGRLNEGIVHCQQGLTITREIGDRDGEGFALQNLGEAYLSQGHLKEAIDYLQHAITIYQEIDYQYAQGYAVNSLGAAYLSQGHLDEAIRSFQRGLDIAQRIGSIRVKGYNAFNMARAYRIKNEPDKALEYARVSANTLSEASAPQATASHTLVDVIQAAIADNTSVEIWALLTCAEELINAGRFWREAIDIAEEVQAIAQSEGLTDLITEAQKTLDKINSILTLPEQD